MRLFIALGFGTDNRREGKPTVLYIGDDKGAAQRGVDGTAGSFARYELGLVQFYKKMKARGRADAEGGEGEPQRHGGTEGEEINAAAAKARESYEALILRLKEEGPERAQLVIQCATLTQDAEALKQQLATRNQDLDKAMLEMTSLKLELEEQRKKKAKGEKRGEPTGETKPFNSEVLTPPRGWDAAASPATAPTSDDGPSLPAPPPSTDEGTLPLMPPPPTET